MLESFNLEGCVNRLRNSTLLNFTSLGSSWQRNCHLATVVSDEMALPPASYLLACSFTVTCILLILGYDLVPRDMFKNEKQ